MIMTMTMTLFQQISVFIGELTSRMRQMKKLITAKPISCARNSMDGDNDICKKKKPLGQEVIH